MTTRHELIIGDDIIATTYLQEELHDADILLYNLAGWDTIPESIRNNTENLAGQGSKISDKRARRNGKSFEITIGARNDTMSLFALRDKLVAMSEQTALFDITLIRYIDIVGQDEPVIRTETLHRCAINGEVPFVWQGEDGESEDVEITIPILSESTKPTVTIEYPTVDEEALKKSVQDDMAASKTKVQNYALSHPGASVSDLTKQLVLTGSNTGTVALSGFLATITITNARISYTLTDNVDITPDWTAVNQQVDADVAATKAAIVNYLPAELESDLTLAQITPFIVASNDNVITLRIDGGYIYVDGSNPRSGYATSDSIVVPPVHVDDPALIASLNSDIQETRDNVIYLLQYVTQTPTQRQLNQCRPINDSGNVLTVVSDGVNITIHGSHPELTYETEVDVLISDYPLQDNPELLQMLRDDVAATKQNIIVLLQTVTQTPSFEQLQDAVFAQGNNSITVTSDGTTISIHGTNPELSVAVDDTVLISDYPPQHEDDPELIQILDDDMYFTYLNIVNMLQYTTQDPTQQQLDDAVQVSNDNVITVVRDGDSIVLNGSNPALMYHPSQTINISDFPPAPDWAEVNQMLDEDMARTREGIENFLVDRRVFLPYEPTDLFFLIQARSDNQVSLRVTDESITIEGFNPRSGYNPPSESVPYTISTPTASEQNIIAMRQNILDYWTANPDWDYSEESLQAFIIPLDGYTVEIHQRGENSNIVGITQYGPDFVDYAQITVPNPNVDFVYLLNVLKNNHLATISNMKSFIQANSDILTNSAWVDANGNNFVVNSNPNLFEIRIRRSNDQMEVTSTYAGMGVRYSDLFDAPLPQSYKDSVAQRILQITNINIPIARQFFVENSYATAWDLQYWLSENPDSGWIDSDSSYAISSYPDMDWGSPDPDDIDIVITRSFDTGASTTWRRATDTITDNT